MSDVQVIDLQEILKFIDGIRGIASKIGSAQKDIQKMLFLGKSSGLGEKVAATAVHPEFVDFLMNAAPQLGAIRLFCRDVIENKDPKIQVQNKQLGFVPNFTVFMSETWMSMIETKHMESIDLTDLPAPSKDPKRVEALAFICLVQGQEYTTAYMITRDEQGHAIVASEPIGGTSALHEAVRPQDIDEYINRQKPKFH